MRLMRRVFLIALVAGARAAKRYSLSFELSYIRYRYGRSLRRVQLLGETAYMEDLPSGCGFLPEGRGLLPER